MNSDAGKNQDHGEPIDSLSDEDWLVWSNSAGYEEIDGDDLEWINEIPPPDDVWYPTTKNSDTSAGSVEKGLRQQEIGVTNTAKSIEEALVHRENLHNKQIAEANEQRKRFLNFVMVIAGAPILASSAGFSFLTWQGKVTDAIAVAFFASVVVEVIGLALVLANYLFPKGAGAITGSGNQAIERDRSTEQNKK
ncbi:hypothetical protein CIP107562_00213 [Corynebacterium diphtheriae]|nr:hypothetical protein CIP107562_00213 [Corynebacterium diphtheriae]CAB0935408.1 hypothetical protein FRC0477_00100 [Corynebacterium diphtheriae]